MLLTSLLVVAGLLIASLIARFRDASLAGTIFVPIIAIYTLRTSSTLLLFVIGLLLAYAGVTGLRRWVLVYGFRLNAIAIILGAAPTVLAVVVGFGIEDILLAASALPGVTAVHLLDRTPTQRHDSVGVIITAVVLVLIAGVLAVRSALTPPCLTCGILPWSTFPPVLLDRSSDIALALGMGGQSIRPEIEPVGGVLAIVVVGVVVATIVDQIWRFTVVGGIELPILVVLALRAQANLVAYVVVLALCFVIIGVIQRRILVIGSPLLPIGVGIAAIGVLGPAVALQPPHGHGMFVAGLLAAVGAYRLHVVSAPDRLAAIVGSVGALAVTFAVARAGIRPLDGGLAATLTVEHIVVGGAVIGAACWILFVRRGEAVPWDVDWAKTSHGKS